MPQLDTAAIEARLAAATPGPWQLRHDGWTIRDSQGNRQIAHTYGRDGSLVEQQVNDACLIAHAPDDIRALLDEVARLRGLVEAALDLAGDMIGYVPEYFQQKHQHQERLAEARKALEAANDRRL